MSNKKITEGIRGAKEGVAECWDDMGGQTMTDQEQMSVTISMPGKNISVTSDSVEEIANILKLAGIEVGGTSAEETPAIAVAIPGMGTEAPEAELPPMGAQTMGQQPEIEMEPEVEEAVGDTSRTSKGGTVTQTSTGQVHKAGAGTYGGSEDDHEDDTPVPAGAVPEKEEEVDESKKPDADNDGVPDWADKHPGEDDQEFDESARILRLAGVTNEAQSAAQKAAFKAMIDKKNGKSEDKADDNAEADDEEKEVEESAEEVPVANNVYGQGVYEGQQEYARILELAGLNEWANSPEGKADDKGTIETKLPSNVGKGGGNSQFGQNRANGQGENPMSPTNISNDHTIDVEEAFSQAMSEYRKFVSESIANKK